MEKRSIKLWIVFFCISVFMACGCLSEKTEAAVTASGYCGDSVKWSLDDSYTLTLSGSGDMYDYEKSSDDGLYTTSPWGDWDTTYKIKKVVVKSGVTSIGSYAFYFGQCIESITIPDSVQKIGKYAFYYCRLASGSINIPDGVKTIESHSFGLCYGISSFTIPDSVTKIEEYAFENCAMPEITIPDNVTEIGNYAFCECSKLSSINIPDSVTKLGESVFYQSGIGTLKIGANVSMSYKALFRMKNLQKVTVNSNNPDFSASDGILFNKDKTKLILYPANKAGTSYTIPDTVTSVENSAFEYNKNLENVVVSDSVEELGTYPNYSNSGRNSVFNSCDSLKTVTLSKRITYLGIWIFSYCDKLETLTIPANVVHIGNNALRGCTSLKTIYFRGDAPTVGNIYPTTNVEATVYIPEGNDTWTEDAKSQFDGTFTWKTYTPSFTSVSSWNISLNASSCVYTGSQKKPAVTAVYDGLTMRNEKDYTVSYKNNINAGTATATITGTGEYTGSVSRTFTIVKAGTDVSVTSYSGEYDGQAHSCTPGILGPSSYTRYYSTDTALTSDNYSSEGTTTLPSRTNAGISTVYYYVKSSDSNYKDASGRFTITILPKVTAEDVSVTYDGKAHAASVSAQGKASLYYSTSQALTFSNHASGTVTVPSRTDTGTTTVYYIAVPQEDASAGTSIAGSVKITVKDPDSVSMEACDITLASDSYTYDGKEKKPAVTVKYNGKVLTEDTDYQLSYKNNVNAGTANVNISGEGKYTGTVSRSFTIRKAELTLEASISADEIKVGETAQIKSPFDSSYTDLFTSEDTAVATVSKSGIVTGVSAGTTRIILKVPELDNYSYDVESKSFTIKVVKADTEPDPDPNPDSSSMSLSDLAWSFANARKSFGYGEDDNIPLSSYQIIFGNTTKAKNYYIRYSKGKTWGGNCAGFSGTSALLHETDSGIAVKDFNASAEKIGNLTVTDRSEKFDMNAKTFIEALQISQYAQLFRNERTKTKVTTTSLINEKENLETFYKEVKKQIDAGTPVLIAIAQGGNGHAVIAYKTEETSSGESRLYVYDNNTPAEERYLTLEKSTSGIRNRWHYDMGNRGIWGNEDSSSSISYVSCDTIEEIWKTRGDLEENENIVALNTKDAAIYNGGDNPVATVTDGELVTKDERIQVVEDLSIHYEEDDTIMLALPVDVYTFDNLNKGTKVFEVSVVNNNLGAKAATTAGEIMMAIDDSCNLNAVYIDADEKDTYSVTLNSSFSYDEDNVVVEGNGSGETLEISQTKGSISINNCQISSISIDGKKVDQNTITSSAGQGGTITPEGTQEVLDGDSMTYTIRPDTGYAIEEVLVDGKGIGAVGTYTFKDVKADHTIEARFMRIEANNISASNVVKTASASRAQSFYLNARSSGNTQLSYSSNQKNVSVSDTGRVTIGRSFTGQAVITIRAAATRRYRSAVKQITITVNPPSTKIKKAKAAAKGFKVTWKKQKVLVDGYQIQYSTNSKFKKSVKTVTIKKKKQSSLSVKKLKKKKKYYIRIRTYKNAGGKRYYSGWSTVKKVKTK